MISLLVSLLPMKRIYRVSIWMISGLSLIGLIVSFSRTFWVFIILGIVIMLFFINNEQRKTLVAGLSIISLAGIIVFFSVFEGKTKMMSMILSNRLMSTTKGTKDLSAYQRFIEYETVLKSVEENPMFGNGLGKTFNFYDPYLHLTQRPKNVHNGYLYIAFRLGIPMLVVFLCFLMMYLGNGLIETRRQKDEFWRLLSFSAFLTILMIAFACLTSNQFFARDGGVILAVSFAIISISSHSRKSELDKNKISS
jgi:O-antigen ligase